MSYHWENVIWQSKDGSWNRAYYTRISNAVSPNAWADESYDSEWDDEFDFSAFDYLHTGFLSSEAAQLWTPYGNPGSFTEIPYSGHSKECKELDQLAFFHLNPKEKAKHERREFLGKNREHFKNLAAHWTPEQIRESLGNRLQLTATIKEDDRAYDYFGASIIVTGAPLQEGDWFLIGGKRIYNLKTDKFEKHVHKLESAFGNAGYRLGTTSRPF